MMAMEMHGAPRCDIDCFIKECVCTFHDRRLGGHLSFFFLHSIFRQQCVLAFVIERKIVGW
jgi:hypothetical protein